MTRDLGAVSSNPVCIWNHAYNEHFDADTYNEIVTGAQDCYALVDPFGKEEIEINTAAKISALQANGNSVGCYMSSGTCENWRDDFSEVQPFCVDQQWGEWAGEYFVYDTDGILPLMQARMMAMADWGCDYVEFDNMDWLQDSEYRNSYGSSPGKEFPAVNKGAAYNQALCSFARQQGMLCMAKNTGQTEFPEEDAGGGGFDGATFESYPESFNWWSNSYLQGFLDLNKPVVIVHYNAEDKQVRGSENKLSEKHVLTRVSSSFLFVFLTFETQGYEHQVAVPAPHSTPSPTKSPVAVSTSTQPTNSVLPTITPPVPSAFELFPYRLQVHLGSHSTGQNISVLQTLDMSGSENEWDTYIELGEEGLANAYRGVFKFDVPSTLDLDLFRRVALTINYYGRNDGGWQFQLKTRRQNIWRWQTIGSADEDTVQEWLWSTIEIPLFEHDTENLSALLGSTIKIRLRTVEDNADVADIDYLKLTVE